MVSGSIRFAILFAACALAGHASGIVVSGTDCGGDPPIITNIFTITANSDGSFCDAFTNNLPGSPTGGSGPSITSLTFTGDLSAGMLVSDYTCTTDIFTNCAVTVDTQDDLLTVAFSGIPVFLGSLDFLPPRGIPSGATFDIGLSGFSSNQTLTVMANTPEPTTILLPVVCAPILLMIRRRSRIAGRNR